MGKSMIAKVYDNLFSPPFVATTDEIELQLLKPVEFIAGEELEYGNIQNETQVVIIVESGIYEEDFPIKIPNNVSIRGDEQRRVIIRPKKKSRKSIPAGEAQQIYVDDENLPTDKRAKTRVLRERVLQVAKNYKVKKNEIFIRSSMVLLRKTNRNRMPW